MKSQVVKPRILLPSLCLANQICFLLLIWIVICFFSLIEELDIFALLTIFLIGVLPYLLYVKILAARWRAITFELKEKEIKETSTFLGFAEKTLQYKNIKQVELKQGLVQRALDIGDVVVTTQATAQHADIQLFNLKEYKEVYEFLLAKLNENQSA